MRLTTKFLLALSICIISTTTALAQNAPWTKILSRLPQYQQVQGTITVQGYQTDIGLGGGTAVAKLWFAAPDSLRIEVQPNAAEGTRGLVVVAQSDQTKIYDPVSHRLRELPYSIVKEWWRGWDLLHGGPANALLAGFSAQQLPQFYNIAVDDKENGLNLLASDDKAHNQPDFTRVGGSGDQIFYAPYLQKVWDFPPQLNLKFDAAGLPTQREEGFAKKVLYRAALTFDPVSHFPKTAEVTDFQGRHVASFSYDLKESAQPIDKSVFTIPEAKDQIPEAEQLDAPASYNGQDAATLYNKGVALALGEEDYAGAYTAWQQASAANPAAVAPWFALYQCALQTHDLFRAQGALTALAKILGTGNEDVLNRQASLAVSFLQWDDAATALNQLIKQQPENAQYLLALANVKRSQGETGAERGLLRQILAMPQAPAGVQAAAALNWSQNALTGTDLTAGDIDDKTPAQMLIKQLVILNNGQATSDADDSGFSKNASLLTALALVQEEAGKDQQAMATWNKVAALFPYPLDRTAHWHLLSLAAQNNDTSTAMAQYSALRETIFNRDDQGKFYDQVTTTWNKAFAQDALKTLLQGRALGMQSSEDDALMWEDFQSTFGTDQDTSTAIKNGETRFPAEAWWSSLRADYLSDLAASPEAGGAGTMSADTALQAALKAVTDAITKDPRQPYYQIQKALILRRISMPHSAVIDPHQSQMDIDAATAAYQKVAQQWAGDSDVQLAVDILRLPLDTDTQRSATLLSLQQVLHQAVPLRTSYLEGDIHANGGNHLRAFSSLQARAAIARRQGDFDEVSQYYQELMVSSRSADEEQGVAINYLRQAAYAKDTDAITTLLTRLAHEPWKWDDISNLMNAAGGILAYNPPLANETLQTLQASSDPYAHWAAARLAATMVASLTLALNDPNAPASLQGAQNASMNALTASLQSLTSVVGGNDKILASRAAAALGESALERGVQGTDDAAKNAAKVAAEWYQKAVAINPGEAAFDVDLITAYHAAGDDASAVKARNAMLAKVLLDPEVMRQAARLTLNTAQNAADRQLAAKIAVAAFQLSQTSTTTSTQTFWHAGITAARCLMAAGNLDEAQEIYQQLSLPQWTTNDRAVAYLDWQHQLQLAGKNDQADIVQQKLDALGLNDPQMSTVQSNWYLLD